MEAGICKGLMLGSIKTTHCLALRGCLSWCVEHKSTGPRGLMFSKSFSLSAPSEVTSSFSYFWSTSVTVGAIFIHEKLIFLQRLEMNSWMQDVILLSHAIWTSQRVLISVLILSPSCIFLSISPHFSLRSPFPSTPPSSSFSYFSNHSFPRLLSLFSTLTNSRSIPQTAVMASPGINIKALHNSTAASIMYDATSHFGKMSPSLFVSVSVSLSLCLPLSQSA